MAPAPPAKPSVSTDAWTADFQRYVSQPDLQNDRPHANGAAAPALAFEDLLRRLPPPAEWARLRQAFAETAAKAPAGMQAHQWRAGGWLFAYLLGDRAALLADLPPAPAPEAEPTPSSYAAERLRAALEEKPEGSFPLEKQLEYFERQLLELEPPNLDEVKRAVGGEDNFARLQRIIEAGKALQVQMMAVYADYEKTRDEAGSRARMIALQKDFETAHAADQQALADHLGDPLVNHFIENSYRADRPEEEAGDDATVPDLVKAKGTEGATALLQRALKVRLRLRLDEHSGTETGKLARALALAAVDSLKVPSWGLTLDLEAAPLFEAMQRRFPAARANDYIYQQACGYYLIGLIEKGRVADAIAFASRAGEGAELRLPYEVTEAFERSGRIEPLWEFLRGWLRKFPAANEWDRFNRLSAQLGRQAEVRALIATMAADGTFAGMDRMRVQQMQADFELAADELDAAQRRLQAMLAPLAPTAELRGAQLNTAKKLLQLADLRQDAATYAGALGAAEAALGAVGAGEKREALGEVAGLMTILNQTGHFADAARLGRTALDGLPAMKQEVQAKAGSGIDADWRYAIPDYVRRQLLGEQLRALVELGEWAQAAELVQGSPWWGAADASALLDQTVSSDDRPFGYYLARVAHQQGLPAVERRLLEAQLAAIPGADSLYESYLALAGQAARPFLAKLAAADRYEERPLIWRGKLQMDAGEWDAAIATLQEAIQTDPSDGEEGRGDRMRVYAFMSRAVAAKGDKEKAAFLDGVVKSIRLSETADRWFRIGAYSHAIALYRQALGFFQDAYCIQSRLAVRLADEGKMDEAAEHYRRAFELMPDSFGRVESHCFGCEHVFAGEKSQGVAEEVFTRMLAARPDKPQLHYLMGYLREEQKKPAEAAKHYRRAVQLDPLYLNAWKRLAGLDDELHFAPAERDELFFKLIEIDPRRRHASPDLARISDLPRLWAALAAAQRLVAELPADGPLWELKASAAEIAGAKSPDFTPRNRRSDFGSVLLEHEFVQALQGYLASLSAKPPSPDGQPEPPPQN